MKKLKYKSLLSSLITVCAFSALTVSCGSNTPTEQNPPTPPTNNNPTMPSEPEPTVTTKSKQIGSFTINSSIQTTNETSKLSLNIEKLSLRRNRHENTYEFWASGILTDAAKQSEFNQVVAGINKVITSYLSDTYKAKIIVPAKTGNKIFADPKNITGAPQEVKITLNNREITLVKSQTSKNLELGELGVKGKTRAEQTAAESIANVNVVYAVRYEPKIDSSSLLGLGILDIKITEAAQLNPLLNQLPINSSESGFKATGISFEDEIFKASSFKAKIESVSDGDTFSVIAQESKTLRGGIVITQGESYRIRLSGIDTPEKGVGSGNNYVAAAPFEYSFALHATNFAEQVVNSEKFKNDIMVGFVSGKDSYDRITADIFFGENYQYSYITEIVRSGHTLPYSNDVWENYLHNKDKSTYEYNLYPKIAEAFEEAIKNNKGMFNYFDNPADVSLFIYLIKNNNRWHPFYYEKTSKNAIVKDYVKN